MTFQVSVENEAVAAGLSEPMARKALLERSEMLHKVFEEAGAEMDPAKVKSQAFSDGRELATFIRKVNDDLSVIGKRVSEFDELAKIRKENEGRYEEAKSFTKDPSGFRPSGERKGEQPVLKTLGELLRESGVLGAAKGRAQRSILVDAGDARAFGVKANFVTTAGWAPESTRTGRVVPDEQREIEITDNIPVFPTNQAVVKYMEETTFTNAAAERAEAGAYAESALALTERSSTVRSIGASLPVSDEQLEDEEGVAAYLDGRLGFMVRQRLDGQIIAGDGVAPNLAGTLNVAGINTQALGGDTIPDAVYKAMDLVRVTGRATPNVVFFHPTDWQPVRLLRTADGIYIWGSPSEAGPARIWGLPVVLSTAMTQNTALVGDYARYSGLFVRKGLELSTGFVNDDFTKGLVHIRAGMRVALVHFRPSAFTQITGV